jgi:drug/metabolite transporter (DMT)-like permease
MMQPTMEEGLSFENFGQLAIIGAAFLYAFSGVWGKQLTATTPLMNAAGMLSCASIAMLPIVLIVEEPFSMTFGIASLGSAVGLSLLSTALAFMLYFKILASAGATNLLLVTFLVPITAMMLGIGVLKDKIHTMSILGLGIIFIGLIVIDGKMWKVITR